MSKETQLTRDRPGLEHKESDSGTYSVELPQHLVSCTYRTQAL